MRRAALVRRGMPSRGGGSEIRRAARGWVVFAEATRGEGLCWMKELWAVKVSFSMEGLLYFRFRGEN